MNALIRLAVVTIIYALFGLILMLVLGVVHHDANAVPALGYWASAAFAIIVATLGDLWRLGQTMQDAP